MASRASGGAVLALLMCLLAITTAMPVGVHGGSEPALRGRISRRGSESSVDSTRYPSPVPPRSRRFDLSHSVSMVPRLQFGGDAEDSELDSETPLRFSKLRSFNAAYSGHSPVSI
jgi:hypothetical protein